MCNTFCDDALACSMITTPKVNAKSTSKKIPLPPVLLGSHGTQNRYSELFLLKYLEGDAWWAGSSRRDRRASVYVVRVARVGARAIESWSESESES